MIAFPTPCRGGNDDLVRRFDALCVNPFFDGGGPNHDYIWARGFRNPFTFTFQPATGLLWVAVRVTDEGNIGFIVSATTLSVSEGSTAELSVAWSSPPLTPISVTAALASGDASVRLSEGSTLTFTPADWSIAQTVAVAADQDPDNETAAPS